MYLVPLNQKNAFLREVSGVAKVLQAQPDDSMWANIRDLTQARSALLDMITAGGESAARARMIRLEARQATAEMPAVALAGLTLQALTIIAGPSMKPVVLSQHQELTSRLEAVPDLTGLLTRQGFLDVGGWRILSRGATTYAAEHIMFDCLAARNVSEKPPAQ